MRSSNPASSMQKTYDQCYITCSTAVYFEKNVRILPCSLSSGLRTRPHKTCSQNVRTTRRKPFGHGARLSTKSITTMPFASPPVIVPETKQKRLFKNPCGKWSSSARSGSICWRPCAKVVTNPTSPRMMRLAMVMPGYMPGQILNLLSRSR